MFHFIFYGSMKIKTMEEREREIEKGKQASDTEKHYFYNFFLSQTYWVKENIQVQLYLRKLVASMILKGKKDKHMLYWRSMVENSE